MPDLTEQTRNAFQFVDKLFLETSYLIKEVEGHLNQTPEAFLILRPAGYGVTSLTSTGLEARNVGMWLRKRIAVAFVPQDETEIKRGQTITPFSDDLRVLFLTIVFDDPSIKEPTVYYGVLDEIRNKSKDFKRFDQLMWELATSTFKMFGTGNRVSFEDAACSLGGEFRKQKLFSLKSNEDIKSKLVKPMVKMYRK